MVVQIAFSYCAHFNMLHVSPSRPSDRERAWKREREKEASCQCVMISSESAHTNKHASTLWLNVCAPQSVYQYVLSEVAIIVYIGYENLQVWNTSLHQYIWGSVQCLAHYKAATFSGIACHWLLKFVVFRLPSIINCLRLRALRSAFQQFAFSTIFVGIFSTSSI